MYSMLTEPISGCGGVELGGLIVGVELYSELSDGSVHCYAESSGVVSCGNLYCPSIASHTTLQCTSSYKADIFSFVFW